MKSLITKCIAPLALAMSFAAPANAQIAEPCSRRHCRELLYIGTRAEGADSGIVAAQFDSISGEIRSLGLAAPVVHPTWVVANPHRPIIYSVSEVGNDGSTPGSVLSFAADKATGKLTPIASVGSGGGGATFLALGAKVLPTHLFVANYGGGSVGVVPLGPAGALGAITSLVRETGSGPSPRQRSPHPHGIALDPSGRYVLVADLGADHVFVHRFEARTQTLGPALPGSAALRPGSGPRHVVFSPDGRFVYVNAELTGEIAVFRWDAKRSRLIPQRAIATRPAGYAGELSSAELAVSPDGRFLYLSNRGEDAVVVFAARADGNLQEVQRLPSGGRSPTSFAIDPSGGWLLVTNEATGLSVFRRDRRSGRLTATASKMAVAHPVSVAFLLK